MKTWPQWRELGDLLTFWRLEKSGVLEEVSPFERQNDSFLDVLDHILQATNAVPADLHGLGVHQVGCDAQFILWQLPMKKKKHDVMHSSY